MKYLKIDPAKADLFEIEFKKQEDSTIHILKLPNKNVYSLSVSKIETSRNKNPGSFQQNELFYLISSELEKSKSEKSNEKKAETWAPNSIQKMKQKIGSEICGKNSISVKVCYETCQLNSQNDQRNARIMLRKLNV